MAINNLIYELYQDGLSHLEIEAKLEKICGQISFLDVLNLVERVPSLKNINEHRFTERNGYIFKKHNNEVLKLFKKLDVSKYFFVEVKSRMAYSKNNNLFLTKKQKNTIDINLPNTDLKKVDIYELIEKYIGKEEIEKYKGYRFQTFKNHIKVLLNENRVFVITVDYYRHNSLPHSVRYINLANDEFSLHGEYSTQIEIEYLGNINKSRKDATFESVLEKINSDIDTISRFFMDQLGPVKFQDKSKV